LPKPPQAAAPRDSLFHPVHGTVGGHSLRRFFRGPRRRGLFTVIDAHGHQLLRTSTDRNSRYAAD
jgi:hypothetical protein